MTGLQKKPKSVSVSQRANHCKITPCWHNVRHVTHHGQSTGGTLGQCAWQYLMVVESQNGSSTPLIAYIVKAGEGCPRDRNNLRGGTHCPVSSERRFRRMGVSERAGTHLVIGHEKMFLPPHVHRLAVPCFKLFTLEAHIILQGGRRGEAMAEARMRGVGEEGMAASQRFARMRWERSRGLRQREINGE
jgi:hypothetical protein